MGREGGATWPNVEAYFNLMLMKFVDGKVQQAHPCLGGTIVLVVATTFTSNNLQHMCVGKQRLRQQRKFAKRRVKMLNRMYGEEMNGNGSPEHKVQVLCAMCRQMLRNISKHLHDEVILLRDRAYLPQV